MKMHTLLCKSLISSCIIMTSVAYANPIDLSFSNPYNVTLDTNIYFSPADQATTATVVRYTNVGSANGVTIDAKVTATVFGDYVFDWHAPDYKASTAGEPNGDIGFLYRRDSSIPADQATSGGLSFLFELFDGSNAKANTYTDAFTADELNIIAYDVDGELDNIGNQQSENLRVFKSDGLISYVTGNAAASLTGNDLGSEILFNGPGTNFDEADTSGAVLLNYANTSSFTLQFESNTFADIGSLDNPVFSAIDGDLFIDFPGPVTSVSEPLSAALLGLGLAGIGISRRKK